ncbi:pectinesterase/pectinesterase inhibitor PPE8B [Arachis hypogaea]|uniref:Pectinesterase n=1 Tax=Arachis hypogaea TaxID=3818 RepID=A0A445DF58_ARAHY|nr:pectinesterase/pectinesterase inhibitor PPE8B [Arachis hypogaea]QHO39057.1 Pectinesterase/pectinesterase inhibitor PPE8B [Arachis hypogaea]RYR61811.1 hypothetical protein Ahy_A04g019035 [Arachis hypogaea]
MAPCSARKEKVPLTAVALTFLLILLLGNFTSMASASGNCGSEGSTCLVPSEFVGVVKEVIGLLGNVGSILSKFTGGFGNFHLTNAILDGLDLLDMSSDELNLFLSVIQNPKGRNNLELDLATWLSAVLANLDTCLDGFEGTNSIIKGLISPGLRLVTSPVTNLLAKVDVSQNDFFEDAAAGAGEGRFPSWVKPRERKLLQANRVVPNAVVAADGSGNFRRIMDAVMAAPNNSNTRFVIYVKRGVYNEYVEINKNKRNIMMIGDGIGATIITGNRNYVDGWTTFRSATFVVVGEGFIARDITFQNTAGPAKKQAVALRTDSDFSVFFRCGIFGYQDTLYVHSMRQFFRECTISGTVDFIFGYGTAVFQKCNILIKKGSPDQKNAITAHGREDPNEPTGFSLQFCNIIADSDLVPFVKMTESFLGRPWKKYSRTVFMQNYISDVISPLGWTPWNGSIGLDTLYYAEYMNTGPGAGVANRVKWPGYRVLKTSREASNFTVANFIQGNSWLPSTGVAFSAGLSL